MNYGMIRRSSLSALALLGILTLLPGCPGVVNGLQTTNNPPANNAPIANAGPNQSVGSGATVTLNGLGSFDPDGDPLTFAWTQTGGTNLMILNTPNTATTTFTAPASDDTLQFRLDVSDGALTGTALVTITVAATTPPPMPPPPTPVLFIANFVGNNVTSYKNPATVNGNFPPNTNLAGAGTALNFPTDVIVDAGGALLVTNAGVPAKITAYDDAVNTNGNLAPDRNVQGAATGLLAPFTLAANTAADLIFVGDVTANAILVYGNASSAAFNGNLAPIRMIGSAAFNIPFGINPDANDNLYVANRGNTNILVFANASNLNGLALSPTRIITSGVFTDVVDVFVDANDNLFVVDSPGFIHTFMNASTLNGAVAPDFTLTIPAAAVITAMTVDSAGNGYVVDFGANSVYSYDNIATRNGVLPPERTITGPVTQLNAPARVYLLE